MKINFHFVPIPVKSSIKPVSTSLKVSRFPAKLPEKKGAIKIPNIKTEVIDCD